MATSFLRQNPFLISNALADSAVVLDLTGKTREEILRELVNSFPTQRTDLRDQLFVAVLEREKLCPTALDGGIAIPHTRVVIAGLVEKPTIVFARHSTGVDFGAADRQLSRLFFLLCADGIKPHLQMLSRLSRLLRSATLRDQLLHAAASADVLTAIREEERRLG